MLNYDDLVTQATERQSAFRTAVEQRRRGQSLVPTQPHPTLAWVGQRLIEWGRQLLGEKPTPTLPVPPVPVTR
jgi:hypothetical protein